MSGLTVGLGAGCTHKAMRMENEAWWRCRGSWSYLLSLPCIRLQNSVTRQQVATWTGLYVEGGWWKMPSLGVLVSLKTEAPVS